MYQHFFILVITDPWLVTVCPNLKNCGDCCGILKELCYVT